MSKTVAIIQLADQGCALVGIQLSAKADEADDNAEVDMCLKNVCFNFEGQLQQRSERISEI